MSSDETLEVNSDSSENPSIEGVDHEEKRNHESAHAEVSSENPSGEPQKQESISVSYETFLAALERQPNAEEKLQLIVRFMEQALAQSGTPRFKEFWEARKLCLPLFKEEVSPLLRGRLWEEYSNLSKEARRLKEILDEQSQFAVEQIEMAVKAIEDDVANITSHSTGAIDQNALFPNFLEKDQSFYLGKQALLNTYNAYAARVNALRKELVKTDMRVRLKNDFFERLSKAGDHIFPQRKEAIQELSQRFINDVEKFIKTYFQGTEANGPPFQLREEIKAFQGIAKALTLNTQAFTATRQKLSECWDILKEVDKEKKKERIQKKALFKENETKVLEKLKEFETQQAEQGWSTEESSRRLNEISTMMRDIQLSKDEVKTLRDEISRLRDPIQAKAKEAEERRRRDEIERQQKRQKEHQEMQKRVALFLEEAIKMSSEEVIQGREQLFSDIASSNLLPAEKQQMERNLKSLRTLLLKKQEEALMSMSQNDREALDNLQGLLDQRKQLRKEIKDRLESYRKSAKGGSGLDFGKAMEYEELIRLEKIELDKTDQAIGDIEEKIYEMQAQIS